MARAYSNDLRRKFLESYDRGKASLREWAEQYGVSLGWAKKISAARKRSGQTELVRQRPGPKSRVSEELKQWLRSQVREQADLTLVELQEKLAKTQKVQLSIARLWWVLKELGLRLKKNRSTPGNARQRKRNSGGKPGRKPSRG